MIDGLEKENNILSGILKKSDESAFYLFDISDGANAVIDFSGKVLIANSSFFRLFDTDIFSIDSGLSLMNFFSKKETIPFKLFIDGRISDPYNSPKTSVFDICLSDGKKVKTVLTAVRIPDTENIFVSAAEPDLFNAGNIRKKSHAKKENSEKKSVLAEEQKISANNFHEDLPAGYRENSSKTDIKSKTSQLEILNEILITANSSFILGEMLDSILEIISERLGFEICFIYLKSNDGKTAEMVSALDVSRSFIESRKKLDVRGWPNNLIFYAGQPKFVENLAGAEIGRYDLNTLESLGALSYAAIPLISENAVIGALFVAKAYDGVFTSFERETLILIGREVSSIILRGMLQERLEKECSEAKQCFGIVLDDINDLNEDLMRSVDKITDSESSLGYLAERMSTGIRENRLIISNLMIIREIREGFGREFEEQSLDLAVKSVIHRCPKARINYTDSGYYLNCDDFLSDLLLNLVDFLMKISEERSEIFIEAECVSGDIIVTLESMGNGLSDEEKMLLFSDFDEENLHLNSNLLGLYTSFMLAKMYGGDIEAADRIPGDITKGLLFRVTFAQFCRPPEDI